LSRQLITTPTEDVVANRTIPMMGMGFSQRSMLTVNNGAYYINTAVSETAQKKGTGGSVPITSINVFQPTGVVNAPPGYGTYYLFFVYATERTKQKYQMYIGKGITDFESNMSKYVKPVRVDIRTTNLKFQEDNVTWTGLVPKYDSDKGILTLNMDFSEFKADFDATHADYCQPKAFCKLADDQKTCQPSLAATDPLYEEAQLICAGAGPLKTGNQPQIAGKDVDCPLFPPVVGQSNIPYCIGVRVTLGNNSQFQADDKNHLPRACCFPDQADQGWKVALSRSNKDIAGACDNTPDGQPAQFCSAVVACDN
jgi:hypothetical protein